MDCIIVYVILGQAKGCVVFSGDKSRCFKQSALTDTLLVIVIVMLESANFTIAFLIVVVDMLITAIITYRIGIFSVFTKVVATNALRVFVVVRISANNGQHTALEGDVVIV